jgi:serine/threonine-protein kinase
MTKTTAVVGSPVYMSPEQMQSSKGVDHRTDIWSLGIILYELVTGRLPFNADTVTELAIRVATEPMPAMGIVPLGLPPGLEHVVQRCLEKARERRFQNVAELADALAPFASARSRPVIERIHGMLGSAPAENPATPGVLGPSAMATSKTRSGSTVAGWQSDSSSRSTGKAAIGVGVAVGLLVVAGSVAVLVRKGPARSDSTPASASTPVASVTATTSAAPAPVPSTSASAASVDSAAPTPDAIPPVAPARSATGRPASPAQPVGPSPSPKAHCNPPYYFDAQGNRVFKKECI